MDSTRNEFNRLHEKIKELSTSSENPTVQRQAEELTRSSEAYLNLFEEYALAVQQLSELNQELQILSSAFDTHVRETGNQELTNLLFLVRMAEKNFIIRGRGDNLDFPWQVSSLKTAIEESHSLSSGQKESLLSVSKGEEGLVVVEELDKTSKEFISVAENLITSIQDVTSTSKKVLGIVETIGEISDSTNLLALNASIEAARAGEFGRGFTVVADEVRKLAERTKTEAQNIHSVLSSMNNKMAHLSKEAAQLEKYSEVQEHSVTRNRSSFKEMTSQVVQIKDHVNVIKESVDKTNHSSDQLIFAMQSISAVAEESAASAEEVSASSEHQLYAIEEVGKSAVELQDISHLLMEEVSKFTLYNEEQKSATDEEVDEEVAEEVDEEINEEIDEEINEEIDEEIDEDEIFSHEDDINVRKSEK